MSTRNVQMVDWVAHVRGTGTATKGHEDVVVEAPGEILTHARSPHRGRYFAIGVIRGDGHIRLWSPSGIRTSAYTRKVLLEAVRMKIEYRDPVLERMHMSTRSVQGHEERILRMLKSGSGSVPRLRMGHRYEQAAFDKAFARVAKETLGPARTGPDARVGHAPPGRDVARPTEDPPMSAGTLFRNTRYGQAQVDFWEFYDSQVGQDVIDARAVAIHEGRV